MTEQTIIHWNDIKDYSKWPYKDQPILIKYKGFVCKGRYSNSLVYIFPYDYVWVYLADCEEWAALEESNED